MNLWILWFIGWIIAVITSLIIHKEGDILYENKVTKVIIILLKTISIFLVLGIATGVTIGSFVQNHSLDVETIIVEMIALSIEIIVIGGILIALLFISLDFVIKNFLYISTVSIISIICWSIPICMYNSNIEIITQTVIESQEERQILYFCNIPVQEVSGEIFGNFAITEGEISTSNELPYWYLNQNGEGIFDSASAESSKIVFIDDDKVARVNIIVYSDQEISKNNNNGTEKIKNVKKRYEYCFYLPKSIMQYPLN